MTTISIDLNPRVLWSYSSYSGRVSITLPIINVQKQEALLRATVERAADEWATYNETTGDIHIRKPRSSNFGGGALREEVKNRVRHVRDVAKAVLREAGFKGVR